MKLPIILLSCLLLFFGCTQQTEDLKAVAAQAEQSARWTKEAITQLETDLANAPPNDPVIKVLETQIAGLKEASDEWASQIEQVNAIIQSAEDGWVLGDIAAGALAPLVPGLPGLWFLLRTIAKRRQETKTLIANIETARVTGKDDNTITLNHDIFKAANKASGLQPIIYEALSKTPS
jgi:hypothetical protein